VALRYFPEDFHVHALRDEELKALHLDMLMSQEPTENRSWERRVENARFEAAHPSEGALYEAEVRMLGAVTTEQTVTRSDEGVEGTTTEQEEIVVEGGLSFANADVAKWSTQRMQQTAARMVESVRDCTKRNREALEDELYSQKRRADAATRKSIHVQTMMHELMGLTHSQIDANASLRSHLVALQAAAAAAGGGGQGDVQDSLGPRSALDPDPQIDEAQKCELLKKSMLLFKNDHLLIPKGDTPAAETQRKKNGKKLEFWRQITRMTAVDFHDLRQGKIYYDFLGDNNLMARDYAALYEVVVGNHDPKSEGLWKGHPDLPLRQIGSVELKPPVVGDVWPITPYVKDLPEQAREQLTQRPVEKDSGAGPSYTTPVTAPSVTRHVARSDGGGPCQGIQRGGTMRALPVRSK